MPDGIALLTIAVLVTACGPLGVWIVAYREAYASESLAHALLPGLLLAALLGFPLVLGAALGALVSAGAISWAGRDPRIGSDTGVAVAVTGLLGAGGLLAVASGQDEHEVEEALFGHLLDVGWAELAVSGGLVAAVVAGLLVAHRRLLVSALDPSRTGGGAAVVVLALIAVATVAAAPVLGNLLVVALLVGPAAAAVRLTGRVFAAQLLSIPLGVLAGAVGLTVAEQAGWDAAACVAVAAVAVYFAASLRSFVPK